MTPFERCRVTAVENGPAAYTLVLTFTPTGPDGRPERRLFDASPYLDAGVFRELREPAYFRRVRLDSAFGTAEWPHEQDFDPATLYAESLPLVAGE